MYLYGHLAYKLDYFYLWQNGRCWRPRRKSPPRPRLQSAALCVQMHYYIYSICNDVMIYSICNDRFCITRSTLSVLIVFVFYHLQTICTLSPRWDLLVHNRDCSYSANWPMGGAGCEGVQASLLFPTRVHNLLPFSRAGQSPVHLSPLLPDLQRALYRQAWSTLIITGVINISEQRVLALQVELVCWWKCGGYNGNVRS